MRLIVTFLFLINIAALIWVTIDRTTNSKTVSLLNLDVPQGGEIIDELQTEAVQLRMQAREGQYHYKARRRLESKINWIAYLFILNALLLIVVLVGLPGPSTGNDHSAVNNELPPSPAEPDQPDG